MTTVCILHTETENRKVKQGVLALKFAELGMMGPNYV